MTLTAGVRELRQRASEWRLVEAGETVEITDRGRPVALLTPLPQGDEIERLRAAGDLAPPSVDLDDLPDPSAVADPRRPPAR
jgi:antitoxin (DNA-binding transcriptional repressor) of toxin-antitoxin stability system